MDKDLRLLPEGTEYLDFMTPVLADSPVGKGDVARILQYEVREGSEAEAACVDYLINSCKLHESMHFAFGGFCEGF